MLRFVILIFVIGVIAAYILERLIRNLTMSNVEYNRRLQSQDMIELSELLRDREYNETPGKILLPRGY